MKWQPCLRSSVLGKEAHFTMSRFKHWIRNSHSNFSGLQCGNKVLISASIWTAVKVQVLELYFLNVWIYFRALSFVSYFTSLWWLLKPRFWNMSQSEHVNLLCFTVVYFSQSLSTCDNMNTSIFVTLQFLTLKGRVVVGQQHVFQQTCLHIFFAHPSL